MRILLVLAAVLILLALVGWISFSSSPDRSSINLETQEIKADTQRAMETGSDLLDEAGDAVDREPSEQTTPTQPAEAPVP